MPEGDTIFRSARALHRVLAGATILAARARETHGGPTLQGNFESAFRALEGQVVDRVEARGKHLLMHTEKVVIHSHMGMHGSWRIYRPHELSAHAQLFARASIEVHTRQISVCCTRPSILEAMRPDQVRVHRNLNALGPDILSPDFDADAVQANLRRMGHLPIGEALLDQRLIAGLGNVYKSEICFLQRLNPFARMEQLSSVQRIELIARARECIFDNLDRSPRVTRFVGASPAGLWVYSRSGRPCFLCGERVRMRRQSELARSTYYCPNCQREPETAKATVS